MAGVPLVSNDPTARIPDMPRPTESPEPADDGLRPTLAEFDTMTRTAFIRLPRRFREMCAGVAIKVEDWPDAETLATMGIACRGNLLGLYHGVSLDRKSSLDVPTGPDMVLLFRRPILLYRDASDDSLELIIIHEIGHHFGLSDEDMERIEQSTA